MHCDELTIASVKTLAATKKWSLGHTLDTIVEYYCRKVSFDKDKPLVWYEPDDA